MGIVFRIIVTSFFLPQLFFAQNPVCPSPNVYMDGGTYLRVYDPGQPLSSTNPATTTIPAFGNGLALMPNINGGTLCPTFYSTSGGNYYYWDGSSWINTGHSTGNTNAINIAGCNGFIYNLVGQTGEVYVYDGQSNGSLLTTLSGFAAAGPYDLVTDCDCNFYAIRTSTVTPGQSLTKFSSSGAVLATYSLLNMPHAAIGTGFAMVGNMVYLRNSVGSGFYVGVISGNSVNFTAVNGFNASISDFASCPSCSVAPPSPNPVISSGMITCANPTPSLSVSSSIAPNSYSWTGPGIMGITTGSDISVKATGIYSCTVEFQGCPSAFITLTTAVTTNTSIVSAAIAPSGHVCLSGTTLAKLSVAHTSSNEIVSWIGPGSPPGGDTLAVTAPGTYTARVYNPGNGCEAQDIVHIVSTPTLQLSLSSNSICSNPVNGSPATLTVTASGALNYTLLSGSTFTSNTPNGPVIPINVLNSNLSIATGTIVGANGMCTSTSTFSVTIVQNPVISVAAASVCPGLSHQFNANGASTYSWAGSDLDTYSGAQVTSTAAATTIYTVNGAANGCFSPTQTTTLTVLPLPQVSVTPSYTTICLGSSAVLTATGTATSHAWSGNSGLSSPSGTMVTVTPAYSQVYTLIGSLNGCTGISQTTVIVVAPPSVSMALSRSTICFHDFNGSPNMISVVPSGAMNYTLLSGTGYAVSQPNGPVMQVTPTGAQPKGVSTFNLQLVAVLGVCTVIQTQTFTVLPNPIVTISPQTVSLCPGQEQIFNLSGASTYSWAASLSLTELSANSAKVNPSQSCFYSVVGSSLGCNSDTKNAVVLVLPAPHITVTPVSATLCAGSGVMMSAYGYADSFTWKPAIDISASSGPNVMAKPLIPRDYTVVATLNTCTVSAIVSLSAIPMPKISASADDPVICSSSSTYLRASGATNFQWTPVEFLNSSSGNQIVATPPVNTTFTVWGYNGTCSGSTSVFVETVQRPDLELASVNGDNIVCYGSSILLSARGAAEYFWSPSAWVYPVSSNTLVMLKPSVSTNFTVVASNHKGSVYCSQQQCYSVTVLPKIVPKVSDNVTLCDGEKTTLVASGGTSYKWIPSSGLNSSELNRVVSAPDVTTVYTVEVSYQTFCGATTTVMVQVNPRPVVFAGRDTTYHMNDAIFISATGTGEIHWVGGDGILCRTCAATQVLPSRFSCYVAEAVNEFGCTATDEVCLDISEDFSFYIPNTFTPNGDGLNDVFMVFGENYSNLSMDIYDRWGQLIYSVKGDDCTWNGRLKGELCKPDTYVYRIQYTGLDRKKYNRTGQITLAK